MEQLPSKGLFLLQEASHVSCGQGTRDIVINEHPLRESDRQARWAGCTGQPGEEAGCLGPGAGWEGLLEMTKGQPL